MGLGLDLGTHSLKVCRTAGLRRLRRGRVVRATQAPTPPGVLRPSLKEPNVADEAALGAALRPLIEAVGGPGWVHLAVPDLSCRVRLLGVEGLPSDRREAARFLLWRMRDDLPFSQEEGRLDFAPLAKDRSEGKVLCVAARASVLAQYERVLASLGCRVASAAPCSVWLHNLLGGRPTDGGSGSYLLAHVGHGTTTLVACGRGQPYFWRSLPLEAGEMLEDAEPLIRAVGDSLLYLDAQGLQGPARILLAGGGAARPGLADLLSGRLGVPVQTVEIAAGVPGGASLPGLDCAWGPALGAAEGP